MALCAMLFISIARRWVIIRVGKFYSDRIGHFSLHTEIYLSGLEIGIERPTKPFFDVWCPSDSICNHQLEIMWRRVLHIYPRWCVEPILDIAKWQHSKIHCIPHPELAISNSRRCLTEGALERTSSHLSFTIAEQAKGEQIMAEMGIGKEQPYVCFHARDSVYLEQVLGGNYSYHDYRDSSIKTMLPAMEQMTERKYVVVRMGSAVREKIESANPKIIDYANSQFRSDFMDIFLSSRCSFFLSTASGVMCPSLSFRRPQCYVSTAPLVTVLDIDSPSVFLPKLHWFKAEQRLMTFREIFATGAANFGMSHQFEDAGIELLPNSIEDISEAVLEMDDRIKGGWVSEPEDETLQNRFWALVPKKYFRGPVRSKIGAGFLREYIHLLD